jgi:NAD(P)-dependent dehydrogenase (short-subunit alcohol dehydrogenase family)
VQSATPQGPESQSLRLGTLTGEPQAQLDGFKARLLSGTMQAQSQRHLYVTQWAEMNVKDAASPVVLMLGQGASAGGSPVGAKLKAPTMIVVACQQNSIASLPLCELEAALTLIQAVSAVPVWLLTKGTPANDYSGTRGLVRVGRSEASLPLHCIGAQTAAKALGRCCGTSDLEPEVVIMGEKHLVPRLQPISQSTEPKAAFVCETHVITGGTAGLGLLTGRWLAQSGAEALALLSRSGKLAHGTSGELDQLSATTSKVLVWPCDAGEVMHVQMISGLTYGALRPRGVWHAAGMLADAMLHKQTADALARVSAPKAGAASLLHGAYSTTPLYSCALFSSVAALLGGAGQANYAAANCCIDALALWRRSSSQAGVSINWGAWAEVGMAARGAASERMAAMEKATGFGRIAPAQGLAALQFAALPLSPANMGVLPIKWDKFLAKSVPAFLSGMASSTPKRAAATVQRSAGAGPTTTTSLETVLQIVKNTAGSAVDADAPLMEAGVDSLGAVELRNQLQELRASRYQAH